MEHGINVGRKRVERLMRAEGLSGLVPKQPGKTTVRVPGVRVADDLVQRQFRPEAKDVLWLADFTYLRTWEGWLYLAAVQDAYSRRIVGWSMADHMRTELVVDALTMAISRRRPDPGLIHHSDQGGQGGFNWWSQRSMKEGCDGQTTGVDERVDGSRSVAVSGASGDRGARGSGGVLVGDRRRVFLDRGGGAGRGVRAGGRPLVSRRWGDANCHAGPVVGGGICRLLSARRSRCSELKGSGSGRSLGGSGGRRRRYRGNCGATPRPAAGSWSIGRR